MFRRGLPVSLIFGATICFLFCCCPVQAVSKPNPEITDTGMGARYENTRMMLRNFYCGHKLRFDASGNLISGGQPGPWTTCSDIRVEKLHVGSGKLKITGHRVYLFYDSGAKQFRDVMEIEPQEYKQTKNYEEMIDSQTVSIEAPIQQADDVAVAATMNAMFYSSAEEFRQAVPEFWKLAIVSPPPAPLSPPNGVFQIGKGISAPTPMFTPDPDYSDEARQARFQGTVALTAIIGSDGTVRGATIKRPLGLGLDEKSIAKVLTWKFKPSIRDGQPVAVEISIEVQFNLY
jgi:TonB family protein